MASDIITLNLGTQTVGVALFQAAPGGGLILKDYRLQELLADGSSELSRVPQMKIALTECCQEMKIKGGRCNYSISGQSVFTRFVKLPALTVEKVDQLVTFEAQQNVPFPIDEVVWDYQLVGKSIDAEEGVEVVLVAIKSDLLGELNEVADEVSLKTSVVDIAPMAIYNAYRYNYSDSSECTLVIDIGGRTTNLVFVEPGRIFTRSIPIGGNSLTAAIAKEFGAPFPAAEDRKKQDGFVGLGGAYAEPSDPEVARISKILRNGMTRLHADIGRSISFYRAQQKGSAPERALLCGGTASLPYIKEFFQEKLQIPVEFFNPLRNVTVSPNVDVEKVAKEAHQLGELVGLGLRSTSDCPMELNLLPPHVEKAQALDRKKPFFALAAACLLAALAGCWYFLGQATEKKEEVLSQVDRKVTQLQGFERQFQSVDSEVAELDRRIEPLTRLLTERDYWLNVVDDLNSRLPERNIWITRMEPASGRTRSAEDDGEDAAPARTGGRRGGADRRDRGGDPNVARVIRVSGLYLDSPAVVDAFVRNLVESPYLDISADTIQEVIETRATPTADRWAWRYELVLPLKEPMRIQ